MKSDHHFHNGVPLFVINSYTLILFKSQLISFCITLIAIDLTCLIAWRYSNSKYCKFKCELFVPISDTFFTVPISDTHFYTWSNAITYSNRKVKIYPIFFRPINISTNFTIVSWDLNPGPLDHQPSMLCTELPGELIARGHLFTSLGYIYIYRDYRGSCNHHYIISGPCHDVTEIFFDLMIDWNLGNFEV